MGIAKLSLNPLKHSKCPSGMLMLNLFLEKIMQETLNGHHTSISIGGRPMCNLRFADDIDLMSGSICELQDLTNRLVDRATAYGMEVTTEKRKIMISSTNNISADISMNGQKLEEFFKTIVGVSSGVRTLTDPCSTCG